MANNKKEFTVLERFPQATGLSRLNLLMEEIRNFLFEKMHTKIEGKLYYTQVEGHKPPFQLFDQEGELGVHGGQISAFIYTDKKNNMGILGPILGRSRNEQADSLWKIMHHANGYIKVFFVYYEGPGQINPPVFNNRELYNGNKMKAYRIRFNLERQTVGRIVTLSNLLIKKEYWQREKR
jgi:hypothetical protein